MNSEHVNISYHAIDRASLRCIDLWENDRKENEGIVTWLQRISNEVAEKNHLMFKTMDIKFKMVHKKVRLYFDNTQNKAVLTTVYNNSKEKK